MAAAGGVGGHSFGAGTAASGEPARADAAPAARPPSLPPLRPAAPPPRCRAPSSSGRPPAAGVQRGGWRQTRAGRLGAGGRAGVQRPQGRGPAGTTPTARPPQFLPIQHSAAARQQHGAPLGRSLATSVCPPAPAHNLRPTLTPTHLQHGAAAQVVGHQRLVRLRQAQLPGQPRRLDGGPLGGARAAVVPRDQHVVGVACAGGASCDGGEARGVSRGVVPSRGGGGAWGEQGRGRGWRARRRPKPGIAPATQGSRGPVQRAAPRRDDKAPCAAPTQARSRNLSQSSPTGSPLTTPEATTPTPFSLTSLTLTRAPGLEDLRS